MTEGDVKLAVFPARSVTSREPETAEPSIESTSGLVAVIESTPERLSDAVKSKATSVLFQPCAFAAGTADPKTRDGMVLSMLTFETLADAPVSALFHQLPAAGLTRAF